jgi:hypothetical protein
MFIRFFRSSFIFQYVALLIIAMVLWLPAFINPVPETETGSPVTPLYNYILPIISSIPWLKTTLALILLYASAIILNNIFIYHDIIPKNSLLPAFLLILFMSSSVNTLTIYPAILTLLPVVFFLHLVYQLYEQNDNPNKALGLGILAAISSMLYFPMIIFILFIWLVILLYRILNWRQWAITFLGFLLPYLYLVVYYFWTDQLSDYVWHYIDYFSRVLNISATTDIFQISIWVVFVLLMLLPAAVRIISTIGTQNITFRRKMSVTVWMAVFTILIFFFHGDIEYNTLVYIPASGIVACHFHSMKKSAWNELVVVAYFALIGVHNFLKL